MEIAKKNDFVEVKYTGYSQGSMFDSNIAEDLKKMDPKGTVKKTVIIVGEGMLVPGFDSQLEGKEIGKQYEVNVKAKDGFGERDRTLVKTIPIKVFYEKEIAPQPGMLFTFDDTLGKVVAVSGGRVMTDFNHALAGKDLTYKFTITRKVTEEKEKVESMFENTLRMVPEFEIKDKIVIKGPKGFEIFVKAFNDKFKQFIGKELDFEEKKPEKKKEDTTLVKTQKKNPAHGEPGHVHEESENK